MVIIIYNAFYSAEDTNGLNFRQIYSIGLKFNKHA